MELLLDPLMDPTNSPVPQTVREGIDESDEDVVVKSPIMCRGQLKTENRIKIRLIASGLSQTFGGLLGLGVLVCVLRWRFRVGGQRVRAGLRLRVAVDT